MKGVRLVKHEKEAFNHVLNARKKTQYMQVCQWKKQAIKNLQIITLTWTGSLLD